MEIHYGTLLKKCDQSLCSQLETESLNMMFVCWRQWHTDQPGFDDEEEIGLALFFFFQFKSWEGGAGGVLFLGGASHG